MISPWQNPLPLSEYTTNRVVVYLYTGRWIPIMRYSFTEAIALYRDAVAQGGKIFIFPGDLDPNDFKTEDLCLGLATAASSGRRGE